MSNYIELTQQFPLRPIRSNDDLDRAVEIIDSLIDRDNLDQGEQNYLTDLSELVEEYETKWFPID